MPFWPWHKKRYNAVDDMLNRLEEEKEIYTQKLEYYNAHRNDVSDDSLKLVSRDFRYRVQTAMDVILIDRFNLDKLMAENEFLNDNAKADIEGINRETPAEYEKMIFLQSVLDGSYFKAHPDLRDYTLEQVYAIHYNIPMEDIATEIKAKDSSRGNALQELKQKS